jgi:hypothetical protein
MRGSVLWAAGLRRSVVSLVLAIMVRSSLVMACTTD